MALETRLAEREWVLECDVECALFRNIPRYLAVLGMFYCGFQQVEGRPEDLLRLNICLAGVCTNLSNLAMREKSIFLAKPFLSHVMLKRVCACARGGGIMALFKPDRRLLNVNFQGYKLAEDSLDLVRVELPSLVRVAELKDDDFSYQHIRAYSLHNHLHFDPSDPSSVYWCAEDGSIVKATLLDDSVSLQSVFSFSTAKLSEFANASILFFNRSMGVVCAGGSEIVLFARSNSILDSTPEKWSILKSLEISDNKPVMVTTVAMAATGMHVDMLCVELGKPLPNSAGIVYMWIRINFKVNLALRQGTPGDIGDVCVLNKFESKSLCLYATFQHQPSKRNVQLLFLNETTPLTEQDEPIDEAGKNAKILEESLLEEPNRHYGIGYEKNSYEWNQTEEEVVITFKLPPDVNKKDIFCEFESNEVVVGLSDGTSLMRGELTHSIDQEASTWTIQDNMLVDHTVYPNLPYSLM